MISYLADTSAWTNIHKSPEVERRWEQLVIDDQIEITDPVMIELLRTEQTFDGYQRLQAELEILRPAPIDRDITRRAVDIFEALAKRGKHRGISVTDLLVAAAAERYNCVVLHYDKDFDLIAEVTGQPTEWIAPRGSL